MDGSHKVFSKAKKSDNTGLGEIAYFSIGAAGYVARVAAVKAKNGGLQRGFSAIIGRDSAWKRSLSIRDDHSRFRSFRAEREIFLAVWRGDFKLNPYPTIGCTGVSRMA
jgi:hypothetical protein